MPNTIVVGDSVGLGISQAITGSRFAGAEGLRIDQMGTHFNSAIASAAQGDTVIISAGYNSTGPNGISNEDVQRLQGWIDQLHAKGARVVIAPLRETGMTGDYAALNGRTAQTNRQLATLRNATVATGCVATANGIPNGEIHGAYPDLARICQAALASAPGETPGQETGNAENNRRAAEQQATEGGFRGFLRGLLDIPILGGIIRFVCGLFGMNFDNNTAAAGGETPNGGAGSGQNQQPANGQSQTPEPSNPERANEQARAAVNGSPAAGTGQDATAPGTPGTTPPFNPLPVSTGPTVGGR